MPQELPLTKTPIRASGPLSALAQIPTTGYPPAPPPDAQPLSAAARMSSLAGAVADRGFQADVVRGLVDVANRGAAAALGAPVDLATAVLRPLGYQHPAPVGGSEWIGHGLQAAGMVTSERRPAAEALAALAVPGALAGGARGLSRLADTGPAVVPSAGRYGATAAEQLGAISPEGKARLLADLTAGKGSGTYRLGDVTAGQAKMLEKAGLSATTNDVRMTDDAFRHLHDKRILQEGYTPEEVATFAEQAMAKRSRVDLDPGKARQQPSLLNEGLRDPVTGKRYDARMPLDSQGDAFGARSAVPDGLPPRKK